MAQTGQQLSKRKRQVMSNNDVFTVVETMVKEQTNQANAIATEVQNSRVNVGKVVHELIKDEDTTDSAIKEFQEWLAKAEAQIEKRKSALIDDVKVRLVKASEMSDEVYEAKKAEYAELKKGINAALKLAANLPGYTPETFSNLPPLMTLSGGTSGAATGTKRPRLSHLTVNGEEVYTTKDLDDGTKAKSFTFTAAAMHISKDAGVKVQPSDLSGAAFAAAKTDDLSTVNAVEFNYSVNGKEYELTVIPAQSE